MKIGERAEVIDHNSEFYGLTVVITDKKVEPKPHRVTVYKVETEDRSPPETFPFSSTILNARQMRPVKERRATDDPGANRDYLLITTIEMNHESPDDCRANVQIERFYNTTKDVIAEHIVKKSVYTLSDNNGILKYKNDPVKYEVVEINSPPECINMSVMCLYEVEKTDLVIQAMAAKERLKERFDELAEFAKSKDKHTGGEGEASTHHERPMYYDVYDNPESIDIKA